MHYLLVVFLFDYSSYAYEIKFKVLLKILTSCKVQLRVLFKIKSSMNIMRKIDADLSEKLNDFSFRKKKKIIITSLFELRTFMIRIFFMKLQDLLLMLSCPTCFLWMHWVLSIVYVSKEFTEGWILINCPSKLFEKTKII